MGENAKLRSFQLTAIFLSLCNRKLSADSQQLLNWIAKYDDQILMTSIDRMKLVKPNNTTPGSMSIQSRFISPALLNHRFPSHSFQQSSQSTSI